MLVRSSRPFLVPKSPYPYPPISASPSQHSVNAARYLATALPPWAQLNIGFQSIVATQTLQAGTVGRFHRCVDLERWKYGHIRVAPFVDRTDRAQTLIYGLGIVPVLSLIHI